MTVIALAGNKGGGGKTTPVINLATALRRRMAYRRAMLEGPSVVDMGKRGAEAAREIEQLIAELVN